MTSPLWQMSQEFLGSVSALESIMENTEMQPDAKQTAIGEILADIEASKGTIEDKLTNCRNYIVSNEADIEAIDREIKRLNELKRHKQNRIAWINDYVMGVLLAVGRKYDLGLFKVGLRKAAETVEITDQSKLPSIKKMPAIWKRKDPEPIKSEIKKRIKAGEQIDGATLIPGKQFVKWN